MAEFKFYLKEITAKKETPIILICHWNKQQLKFYLGMMALTAVWNKKEGRFRQTKENVKHKALTQNIEQSADNTYVELEAKLKRITTKEEFREALITCPINRTQRISREEMVSGNYLMPCQLSLQENRPWRLEVNLPFLPGLWMNF